MFKRKVSNQEISQYVTDLASLQEQRYRVGGNEHLFSGDIQAWKDEIARYSNLIEICQLTLERLMERAG